MTYIFKLIIAGMAFFLSTIFIAEEFILTLGRKDYVNTQVDDKIYEAHLKTDIFLNKSTISETIKKRYYAHYNIERKKEEKINQIKSINKYNSLELFSIDNFLSFLLLNIETKNHESLSMRWQNQRKNDKQRNGDHEKVNTTNSSMELEHFDIELSCYGMQSALLVTSLTGRINRVVFNDQPVNLQWELKSSDKFQGRVLRYGFSNEYLVVQYRKGAVSSDLNDNRLYSNYDYFIRVYSINTKKGFSLLREFKLKTKEAFDSIVVSKNTIYYSIHNDIYSFRSFKIKLSNESEYLPPGKVGPLTAFKNLTVGSSKLFLKKKSTHSKPDFYSLVSLYDHTRSALLIEKIEANNKSWNVNVILKVETNKEKHFNDIFSTLTKSSFLAKSQNEVFYVISFSENIFFLSGSKYDEIRGVQTESKKRYSKMAISEDGQFIALYEKNSDEIRIVKKTFVDNGKTPKNNKDYYVVSYTEIKIPENLRNLNVIDMKIISKLEFNNSNNYYFLDSETLFVLYETGVVSLHYISSEGNEFLLTVLNQFKFIKFWEISLGVLTLVLYLLYNCFSYRFIFTNNLQPRQLAQPHNQRNNPPQPQERQLVRYPGPPRIEPPLRDPSRSVQNLPQLEVEPNVFDEDDEVDSARLIEILPRLRRGDSSSEESEADTDRDAEDSVMPNSQQLERDRGSGDGNNLQRPSVNGHANRRAHSNQRENERSHNDSRSLQNGNRINH